MATPVDSSIEKTKPIGDITRKCDGTYNQASTEKGERSMYVSSYLISASHFRQSGIESEIVDLVQGRVPKTVFGRHYFTPAWIIE